MTSNSHGEQREWGLCVDCRFWQIEPKAIATHQTAGLCLYPLLREFRLRVTGNSGCREFQRGQVARGEGSSLKPPPAPQHEPSPPSAP